jgi:hypothetical protein
VLILPINWRLVDGTSTVSSWPSAARTSTSSTRSPSLPARWSHALGGNGNVTTTRRGCLRSCMAITSPGTPASSHTHARHRPRSLTPCCRPRRSPDAPRSSRKNQSAHHIARAAAAPECRQRGRLALAIARSRRSGLTRVSRKCRLAAPITSAQNAVTATGRVPCRTGICVGSVAIGDVWNDVNRCRVPTIAECDVVGWLSGSLRGAGPVSVEGAPDSLGADG